MKFENFELKIANAGYFKLDGGAMHGRVPKALWKNNFASDRLNRIKLATNCLLVRTPKQNILIDTGNGSHWDKKTAGLYGINPNYTILHAIKKYGLTAQDIDIVINTHLHFDHAGGNTFWDGTKMRPTFPKAKYFCQKNEFAMAGKTMADQGSYRTQDFEPLQDFGQIELIEGNAEIIPGVETLTTPGHTAAHQSVLIKCKSQTIIFLGDLVPTSFHIRLPYTMGFDLYPVTVIETKKTIFPKIIDEKWLCIWYHDSLHAAGYLNLNQQNKITLFKYIRL